MKKTLFFGHRRRGTLLDCRFDTLSRRWLQLSVGEPVRRWLPLGRYKPPALGGGFINGPAQRGRVVNAAKRKQQPGYQKQGKVQQRRQRKQDAKDQKVEDRKTAEGIKSKVYNQELKAVQGDKGGNKSGRSGISATADAERITGTKLRQVAKSGRLNGQPISRGAR